MSRGPSPSPSSATLLPSTSSTSTITDRPARPPRAPLRVNTDSSSHFPSPSSAASFSINARLRSNSSAHPRQSPPAAQHHFSRSLSSNHAVVSPSSPGRNDVVMAVNGLRGMLGERPGNADMELLSPIRATHPGSREAEDKRSKNEVTMQRIHEALAKSNDQGDTLDLSRKRLESIDGDAVEMFKRGVGKDNKGVWRLALSYNALRDGTIADSFSRLSRLRYLNLKGNALTQFPHALTGMASLEILDLSKNRIEAFPEVPGRLNQLKVLSLTSNRIYALPSYLTTFDHLKVFKVDMNPIEWPPREVLGSLIDHADGEPNGDPTKTPGKAKKDEDLRPWIENMKSWMRQRAADTERLIAQSRAEDAAYFASEEEPVSAASVSSSSLHQWRGSEAPVSAAQHTMRPVKSEALSTSPIPPRPPYSRNRSATLSEDSLVRPSSPGLDPPYRPFARHDRSHSNSSFDPPQSASSVSSSSHSRAPSTSLSMPPVLPAAAGHSRGASYTATQRMSGGVTPKKSLPDLRLSHAQIIQDRRQEVQPESTRPLGLGINTPGSARFQNSISIWSESPRTPGFELERPRNLPRKGSVDMLRQLKSGGAEGPSRRDSAETLHADDSRNSYFRRLSTLPPSTLAKAIPSALLRFIDAIRGILFALSQLHSALRQYLVYAVHDKVAGVFSRVLEPASSYMNTLINALDRFDSMSRRSTPPASAIRSVIEATKESIAVFAKVVAVLRLQMPALKHGDVRYTRTLLLMIYGSMTEIGCSWSSMAPLMSEIKPLLAADAAMAARAILGGHKMVATGSLTGRTPISPIPERGESRSPSSAARSSISTVNASPSQPVVAAVAETPAPARPARSRRQGGSFSAEDVDRGMLMRSPGLSSEDDDSALGGQRPYIRHRPSESAQIVLEDQAEEPEADEAPLEPPRAPFARTHTAGPSSGMPVTPPELSSVQSSIALANNSHHPHGRHKPSSSSGSMSAGLAPMRKLSVDVRPPTPSSATLFDEDLLDVIETATDIAFTVWLKLADDIGASAPFSATSHSKSNSQSSFASTVDSTTPTRFQRPASIPKGYHTELVHLLSRAEQITSALRESLAGIRANPLTWTNSSLPDDAQAFIKTVVKVSELVKFISATHTFPLHVRQHCSKLTQATRECAILIQVSSLRPGNGTPAPMVPVSARAHSPSGHDSRASSSEDLGGPPNSAAWPGSAPGSGLRGLQLPTRHAMSRSKGSGSGVPRSAQASQTTF